MRIDHVNIVVSDLERSQAFYGGLLGMRETFKTVLEGTWVEAVTGLANVSARCLFFKPAGGGPRFELLQYVSPLGLPVPGHEQPNALGLRHIALDVADLDAWHARLSAAGVEFLSPPVSVPFLLADGRRKRLCYLRDPDGVLIELAEYQT